MAANNSGVADMFQAHPSRNSTVSNRPVSSGTADDEDYDGGSDDWSSGDEVQVAELASITDIKRHSKQQSTAAGLLHYTVPALRGTATPNRVPFTYCTVGAPSGPSEAHVTYLLVGEESVGKSRLVDVILNHCLGVEFDHQDRYHIVEELMEMPPASKATPNLTCYKFHQLRDSPVPYTIEIIDTPGIAGGTTNQELDFIKQIVDLVERPKVYDIKEIDVVLLVVQGTKTVLSSSESYLFSSIRSRLKRQEGVHVEVVLTFTDGHVTSALSALQDKHLPVQPSYCFNNMALDAHRQNDLAKKYWRRARRNLERLLQRDALFE